MRIGEVMLSCEDGEEGLVHQATKAYRMGIDFPSVWVVIHLDLHDTILDWLQETECAGCNGLPALALTVFTPKVPAGDYPMTFHWSLVSGGNKSSSMACLVGHSATESFPLIF